MALIAGAVFILFHMAVYAVVGNSFWLEHRQVLNGVDVIVAGATVLAIRLTVLKHGRQTLTDPETGHTYNFKVHDDIFWIDILWWSLLVIGLGVWQMVPGNAWNNEFTAWHEGPTNERIVFWSICGAAIALTVFALVFRGRDVRDQAYHSPLMLLGMAAGLPIAYAFGNVFILEAIEHGEMITIVGGSALLFIYTLGTLQAAAYKISWDENAFRVRRLLGGTTEVLWTEIKSIKMESADAFEMKTENERLRRHTISNHLTGSERFVGVLQLKCRRAAANDGAATVPL